LCIRRAPAVCCWSWWKPSGTDGIAVTVRFIAFCQRAMNPETVELVKEVQGSMLAAAPSDLNKDELEHLRAVIRLTIEFHDYLENGDVGLAQRLQQVPNWDALPMEFREEVQGAVTDPFNRFDLSYNCESILWAIDSFVKAGTAYRKLNTAPGTKIVWGAITSRDSFKGVYLPVFDRFLRELDFETRYRLLLDLYRLQIIFAAISYDD
jgi:hypothetical protein